MKVFTFKDPGVEMLPFASVRVFTLNVVCNTELILYIGVVMIIIVCKINSHNSVQIRKQIIILFVS